MRSYKYQTLSSDDEALVLEIWRMWNTPSSLLIPVPLWPGVVVAVRVPSMGQIEKVNHSLRIIVFNYLKPDKCVEVIYIT